MTVDTCTEKEYTEYFDESGEKAWTKEETDKLFELCQRLDTRFITVADRMEGRSVEDVKARYYTIARKLLDTRGKYNDDQLSTMPLYRFQYDKEYDVRRKQQLNQLHNRTKEDEEEEAVLMTELKAIDACLKADSKLRTRVRKAQEAALRPPEPEEELGPRGGGRRGELDTVTMRRPKRESAKRIKFERPSEPPAETVKVPRGFRGVEVDNSAEGRLKVKLQELGVDEWPLPIANVTVAHSALIDDLNKLVALEMKLEQKTQAQRAGE